MAEKRNNEKKYSENSNFTNNTNYEINLECNGVLSILDVCKLNNINKKIRNLKTIKITFIKTTSDEIIMNYVDVFFLKIIKRDSSNFTVYNNIPIIHNIGLRVIILFK